jgi:hypothetical protein
MVTKSAFEGYIEVFSKRAQKELKEDFDNVSGWQRLGQAL